MLQHGYNLLVSPKLAHFTWVRGEGVYFQRGGPFLEEKKVKAFRHVAETSPMSVIAPNTVCEIGWFSLKEQQLLYYNQSSSWKKK